MEDGVQAKIFQLLDVISIELAANRDEIRDELRKETGGLRDEMRLGFSRVERRLGNLETRVEGLETRVGGVETELRSFRCEFDRRITPLEQRFL